MALGTDIILQYAKLFVLLVQLLTKPAGRSKAMRTDDKWLFGALGFVVFLLSVVFAIAINETPRQAESWTTNDAITCIEWNDGTETCRINK